MADTSTTEEPWFFPLFDAGKTPLQVARQRGVALKTGRRYEREWRRARGLPPRRGTRSLEARYRTLFETGRDDDYIMRVMGINHATLVRWRNRLGYPAPLAGRALYEKLLADGLDNETIAKQVGVDRKTVQRWRLRICGATPQFKYDVDNGALIELWNAGKTAGEIRLALGTNISSDAIDNRIALARKKGLITRPKQDDDSWTEEELARAKAMLDDGMSYKMVAEELGRKPNSYQSLAKHFPGMGWTPSQTQQYRWMREKLEAL